jgi:hypothetical protein
MGSSLFSLVSLSNCSDSPCWPGKQLKLGVAISGWNHSEPENNCRNSSQKATRRAKRRRRKRKVGGDSHKENEMRKTRKKVNEKIGQIVAESSNEDAGQLFKALSKIGGNKFRRAMRRVHRIIEKQAKRRK